MDTKVIAMVGAVIVVGAAVYGVATGTVLPGTDELSGNEPAGQGDNSSGTVPTTNTDTGDIGGSGGGSSGGGSQTGTAGNTTGNKTEEVTDTGPESLPVICDERGGNITRKDVDSVNSAAGPPLDPLLAESMLHNKLNKVRALRSDDDVKIAPLKCDPELREIARDHSQLILIQEGARGNEYITSDYQESQERIEALGGELELEENLESLTRDDVVVNDTRLYEREGEEVCENPVMEYGNFAYGVNIEGGDSGDFSFDSDIASDFADDQEQTVIRNHDDLTRDARRIFVDDNLDLITNPDMTRQGIGVATDRRTGETVVTLIVCGPRNQSQDQEP